MAHDELTEGTEPRSADADPTADWPPVDSNFNRNHAPDDLAR